MAMFLAFFVALSACGRSPELPPAEKVAARDASPAQPNKPDTHHEELPSRVSLSPQVRAAVHLEVQPVAIASLPATVELTGEIAPDPDRSAQVVARAQGRIVQVSFKEGDWVKAGALLVVLNSPELAHARAALTSAGARANAARLNAERLRNLAKKGLASGQELATATAEARALEADETAASQSLAAFGSGAGAYTSDAARLELRTPIDGYVLKRNAVAGQVVGPEWVLAVVANLNRAYFLGRLFEKDLSHVTEGAKADIRLNAYPKQVFQGDVETIGREIDPSARTVVARIVIKDQGRDLKAGLFGIARVVMRDSASQPARIVVPLGAITQIANRDVVFVQDPNGEYAVHQVTLGRSAEGRVEVLEGLRAGEQVVTSGVFTLKSVVLKGTFGEEGD
ncbi:MAG: efflux RND transporter periplasmic adaptor subunit [Candidatus Binatus sp.]|uniref:efflux RND transporter periplasmic adaptor subunit n=1 Tax=Candidatus Binatus sp. TaxID=2811406 RepID=UPI002719E1B4|nr:efflux RND transporter periplasmic adaptor subunit [Candidatus Binatus sp.]MDO8433676.1 efflux RND transporter periplasmic adaptor subunit [Candidatus Binatus sp.]